MNPVDARPTGPTSFPSEPAVETKPINGDINAEIARLTKEVE